MLALTDTTPWYLNPVFLPAAFGLLGVVVGGLITAVGNYFLDQNRDKRIVKRDNHGRSIERISAARVLHDTFDRARIASKIANKEQSFAFFGAALSLDDWSNNRGLLAAAVSSEEWSKLRLAALILQRFIAMHEGAVDRKDNSFKEGEADRIKDYPDKIGAACDILQSLADKEQQGL